jgi:hypothetical protein
MNIIPIKKETLDYIIIDDFYTQEELQQIYNELFKLLPNKLLPNQTATDYIDTERTIPKNSSEGLFLNQFYNNFEDSSILKFSRKLYTKEIYDQIEKVSVHYQHLRKSNVDVTLLNFYKNGQEYLSHSDESTLSAITFLKIGEVAGGDLIFTDFNEVIKFKENRLVLFPGCLNHQAEKTIAEDGNYRISIVNFIKYKI